jgi:predicted AAA+ superfamily ATPase
MYDRHLEPRLRAALADTPVVLLNGARQTGKTTLVQRIAAGSGAAYLTMDDAATLNAAMTDPAALVRGHTGLLVIDEVQKAPQLLPAIKMAVDARRRPGRFLLTGSANVLALPKVSESLAGRMEVLTLWPLSQGEIYSRHEKFIDALFSDRPLRVETSSRTDFGKLLTVGGYPEAVQRKAGDRRSSWFASYVTTILQRDVRDIANIEGLVQMPRLLSLLAARSSGLLNISELSRASTLPHTTLQRYLALLELTHLLQLLPAWSTNRSKRLVKSPKVHLIDSGLAAHLALHDRGELSRSDPLFGGLLETWVVAELKKLASWSNQQTKLYHFRTAAGREVDVVLEGTAGRVVGVEVKATASINGGDFAGLRALAEEAGKNFVRGVLLYGGDAVLPFGDGFYAVPISSIWGL